MARAGDPGPTIFYDRDCGFCRWTLSKILFLDRRHRLRPVAIQDVEAQPFLGEMDDDVRLGSWHIATPDGEVRSAGAGFPLLFRELPGGKPIAALAAKAPGLSERAYRFVAGNRTRFGKRIPDAAKRRADRRIAERASGR